MSKHVFDELVARELMAQCSDEAGVRRLLDGTHETAYVGFDPTAPSLHVGHLLPVVALALLQRSGVRPIVLIGGATGMIGDPSGRVAERSLITPEMVVENMAGIRRQLENFMDFTGPCAATMVNNADWICGFSHIDWLRVVGKHFSVNYMISKESVRKRLEEREQGISYTEFSYMLLQAYDFLHLNEQFGCRLQAGGNDQWGNITAGIELVRRVRGESVHGLTFPLMTTANGEKFGKSAGNAVWLDPNLTGPFQFYQYWMQADDTDVERYLKCFTSIELPEIAQLMASHRDRPEGRAAQTRLAHHMTGLVHGASGLRIAERVTRALFDGDLNGLEEAEFDLVLAEAPGIEVEADALDHVYVVDLLVRGGLCDSKGAARRLVYQGGVYLNGEKVDVERRLLATDLSASLRVAVLRAGKRRHLVVRLSDGTR